MEQNSNTPSTNAATNLIKQYIVTHYRPCRDYLAASIRLTTAELYSRLAAMYPGSDWAPTDLYTFLKDQEFTEVEVRPFYTEWLFEKIPA